MTDTQDTPPPPPPPEVRYLKVLVTLLTAVLIVGMVSIVVLMFLRLSTPGARIAPDLPAELTLPEGTNAAAVTLAPDWVLVLTDADEVLVFDRSSGALLQRMALR